MKNSVHCQLTRDWPTTNANRISDFPVYHHCFEPRTDINTRREFIDSRIGSRLNTLVAFYNRELCTVNKLSRFWQLEESSLFRGINHFYNWKNKGFIIGVYRVIESVTKWIFLFFDWRHCLMSSLSFFLNTWCCLKIVSNRSFYFLFNFNKEMESKERRGMDDTTTG